MTLLALGIALLALAISAGSFYWSRRLATADEVIARSAIDRRHDETIPRLSVTVADRTWVTFVNNGPQDLDRVEFDIVDGTITGLRVDGNIAIRASLGALPIGSATTVEAIEGEFGIGGLARLRFTCRANDETWIVGGYFDVAAVAETAVGGRPVETPAHEPSDDATAASAEAETGVVWPSRGDRLVEYTPQLG